MDKYLLSPEHVERQIEVAGKVNAESKDITGFLHKLGERASFDTGWLPPGLRSYTQAGNHAQMVIVCPPAVNRLNWGKTEGDPDYQTYLVAQPWRVLIADLIDGNLLGVRMFYSPTPVNSLEQQLYHQNVPNINCKGYSGNGVGWVCLYHKESWQGLSLGQKIERVIERCSGVEAYNDANMDSTDGPRFYREMDKPDFTFDPKSWETKTEREGVTWTFDEDLWIPIRVKSDQEQDKHAPKGKFLTLEMAMNGKYNAYYGDKNHPKPATQLRQGEPLEDEFASVREAYAKAQDPPKTKKKATAKKKATTKPKAEAPPTDALVNPDPVPAFDMLDEDIVNCVDCGVMIHDGDGIAAEWGEVCFGCGSGLISCDVCYIAFQEDQLTFDNGSHYCNKDLPEFKCTKCEDIFSGHLKQVVETPHAVMKYHELCPECMATHMICNNCTELHDQVNIVATHDMQLMCVDCVEMCDDCMLPVLKEEVDHHDVCKALQAV